MPKELNLFYVHSESLGYGRYGVKLAEALARAGVTIYDDMPGAQRPGELVEPDRNSGLTATMCMVSVPSHCNGYWDGQYTAISTMWETMYLPETFREALDNYDQIIVPSLQNQELFGAYHPNVTYVPLGFDAAEWQPTRREMPDQEFRFLYSGSGPRKGGDLVMKAFYKLWPSEGSWPRGGPTPMLIYKTIKGGTRAGPRMLPIAGRISAETEQLLYRHAHVYVQPSRGEGFGLQPLQAIASGLPTILTDAHGHAAFSHLGMGLSTTMEHNTVAGGSFTHGEAGEWWAPSFDELCDWMLYCYESYAEAADTAWDNAQKAHAEFTWDHTAEKFIAAFPEGQLEREAPTAHRWREMVLRKYLVRVVRDHKAEIGGTVFRWEKGRDYCEAADVKRILFDCELLDPSCLSGKDNGLTPLQLERIPDYSARFAFCPECHQRYNSGELDPIQHEAPPIPGEPDVRFLRTGTAARTELGPLTVTG